MPRNLRFLTINSFSVWLMLLDRETVLKNNWSRSWLRVSALSSGGRVAFQYAYQLITVINRNTINSNCHCMKVRKTYFWQRK